VAAPAAVQPVAAPAAVPPVAAPPAVAPAAVPAGPLDLQTVAASWPAVVELVRGANAMLAALLADARPIAVSEREVTIAFPPGAAFLKRKAEQDDHRRVAADAFKRVAGQALALRYELRDAADPENEPSGVPGLSGEELVKRFLEEFNAEELLDDEPDEREAEN
jgi:DNA polymerase-3 subunit gamma/tau